MQLLSAEIFSSVRKHCPPEMSSTSRYLSRLADLPISRFAGKFGSAEPRPPNSFRHPSLVPRPTPRFKSVATKPKPAEAG